ncbi:unnamed protein product [Dracunculus medinensis]|uniref:UBA domain-containing protein n=1 Tax=Dracunculus medinensis TaxID=318479 RepID=A0A0N4UCE1_DRAME|nr:unnamed protein product [Dracunculus medinensis]
MKRLNRIEDTRGQRIAKEYREFEGINGESVERINFEQISRKYAKMFNFNLSSLIVVFSGVFVSLLYRNKLLSMDTVDFIPPPLSCFLTSNSNFFGSMINKFTNFGEIASNNQILPVAATLERQRMEAFDEYEKRLLFMQMRQLHMDEQANSSESRLNFLNRLFGRHTNDEATMPNEDQIRQLMDMGFRNRYTVIEALQRSGNDASVAATILLNDTRTNFLNSFFDSIKT